MRVSLLALFIGTLPFSPALGAESPAATLAAPDTANHADLDAIERFAGLVEKGKKEEAADLVQFPLRRRNPLPALRNKQEFVASFGDFFDAKTSAALSEALKKKDQALKDWRGTGLDGGMIWASGGKITAINLATAKQEKAAAEALRLEKRNTHSSVDKYEAVEFACDAPSHRVRVQRLVGGNYRYVSWRPGENLSAVPEQVLEKGEAEHLGSGGGTIYRFRDGKTLYEVTQTGICGEDCNSYLQVTRGKKTALKEACKPLP